jgi:Protein of unknown function (DUF1553)/Concanavalin A-like lectin/glucanases superfamily
VQRTASFTASVWCFPTSEESLTLLAKVEDAFISRGFSLALHAGKLTARLRNEAKTNEIVVASRDSLPLRKWQHVAVVYDGSSRATGFQLYLNGKALADDVLADSLSASSHTNRRWYLGQRDKEEPFRGLLDEVKLFARALSAEEIALLAGGDPIQAILAKRTAERTPSEAAELKKYFWEQVDPQTKTLAAAARLVRRERNEFLENVPTAMVMEEQPTLRDTFVLERGIYNQPREKVLAGVPNWLPHAHVPAPNNRLALAHWLMAPENPLTARVQVNRLWLQFFGRGLVATPDDFGVRGATPSHPALLDWLAVEFRERGWDQKHLIRLIVTSATYRQASRIEPQRTKLDANNVWLARQNRLRLPAEAIRDSALFGTGLLKERVGGASVFPLQPGDSWKDLAFDTQQLSAQSYRASRGEDLYRRGLYTFWKRTTPHPFFTAFDAPNRETCVVQRPVSYSPQQALALLNDVTLLTAARTFAESLLANAALNDEQRISLIFQSLLGREPNQQEMKIMRDYFQAQTERWQAETEGVKKFVLVGETLLDSRFNLVSVASWMCVVSTVMNSEEFVHRP